MSLLPIGTWVTTEKDQPNKGKVVGTRHNTTETLVRWHAGYATWEPSHKLIQLEVTNNG